MTYISQSSDFVLYLEDYLMYEHHTLGLWVGITWDVWLKNKCMSLWPIFHGPVILCYIFKTKTWVGTSHFGIMGQCDATFNLRVNVGLCDLYFMVQWFCLISWRLFDVWTSLFGIMCQCDLRINVGLYGLYFMVQWFCLIPWRLFGVWTSLFGIMSQYDPVFDLKINVCHYDLYFSDFALYCLKTVWCRNTILCGNESLWCGL